jgi:LCP family protein required for cell wall assembly
MADDLSNPTPSAATRGAAPGGPPGPPHSRTRMGFLIVAGVLALVMAGGSAFAIGEIKHLEGALDATRIDVGSHCQGSECLSAVNPFCQHSACNFLILGSDTRTGLTQQQQQQFGSASNTPGQRADTIIVVQVDVPHHRTIVLSIPRDTLVDIPGHGMNKINTAFSYGPNVMVQTVERFTGLTINHYVEVNFIGFQDLVNALGGVPICINKPLIDPLSGLHLAHAGCYNLYGPQALAFVRARHIQGDLIPDFSRITRQQQFIRAVIQKTLSPTEFLKLPKLVAAAKDNLRIDKNLNLYDLQDLTHTLANLGQGGVIFRLVPATPVVRSGIDYVVPIEPQASELFERIRDGRSLGFIGIAEPGTPISPASVTVRVYDANSGGRAQQVAAYLAKAGFLVLPVAPAPPSLTRSTILRSGTTGAQEAALASYFDSLPVAFSKTYTSGTDVAVVVAAGFKVPTT